MYDELVLADSAGHTMIDIESARAADRAREAEPAERQESSAEEQGGPPEGEAAPYAPASALPTRRARSRAMA